MGTLRRRESLIAFVCGGLLACGTHGGRTTASDAGAGLSVATFNLGLLNSVGFVPERAPLAIDATAKLAADLFCVQEVWEQANWDALAAAHHDKRPYSLHLAPNPGAVGMCSPDDFNPLQACAQQACAQAANLVTCVTEHCGSIVATLATSCTGCLVQHAASGDFDAIRAACVGAVSDAGTPERSYVSGGSYGIGLLSAQPFAASDQKLLDASTVRRAILYGRLDDTPVGTVHVFCTHLTAILTGLKYEGSYGDFAGENAAHVQTLIDWVHEKAGEGAQVLVLGDLNTGPASGAIAGSVPENYAKLPQAGFADPFLTGPQAACTFCKDNPLVLSDDPAANATIDHILTRGISKPVSVSRVFDTLVEIDVPSTGQDAGAIDGGLTTQKRTVGLSDHYGLHGFVSR